MEATGNIALVVGGSPAYPQAKQEEHECPKPNYEIEYPPTHLESKTTGVKCLRF